MIAHIYETQCDNPVLDEQCSDKVIRASISQAFIPGDPFMSRFPVSLFPLMWDFSLVYLFYLILEYLKISNHFRSASRFEPVCLQSRLLGQKHSREAFSLQHIEKAVLISPNSG